jgi:predicted KAP-like P-loop ATPase
MILPDTPIEDKDSDKLRRAPLAVKVAELVNSFEGKESFVVGIEGVWGSGKTSFVNLVVDNLSPEKTVVIPFNPWNFSGQNELIEDFFTTLVSQISEFKSDKNKAKQIKGMVSKLTRKSEFAFSPEISAFAGLVKFKANDLFKWSADEKTLQQERKDADILFRGLDKKIVVVIDDIDRLDKFETRLIMKLVKMTANFPRTVFLLAYDRKRVAQRLAEDGWDGEEFLKKIIQVSFTLPEPDRQGLNNILFSDLDASITPIYGEVKLEGEDEKRWNSIGYAGFPLLFKTIRDIKRFISSLRLNWSIMGKEEINMVDFIAIEAIRVFAPDFYSGITSNKSLFTSTDSAMSAYRSKNEASKAERYAELLKRVPEEIRPIIEKITTELFPQMGTGYGHDWQQKWRTDRRICAEERFDFYFQLGIPEGRVSETETDNAIKTLTSKEEFTATILKEQEDKKLRAFLSKLLDYVDKLTKDQVKVLALTLWDLEKKIDDGRSAGFDFNDVETQTLRLVYHAIKKVVPKAERGAFISELIKENTTLYYPTHFVAVLGQELEKEGRSEDDYLITKDQIGEPEQLLLTMIKKAAQSGTLVNEPNFAFFIFRWKHWENAEEPKKYLTELIKTRNGLLSFLKGFVQKVYSSNGNYNHIDKKGLTDLIPKETLDDLVNAITSDELAQMGEKEKEAVELYKNPKRSIWD